MQSFSGYSQRIAMRPKRALETMHEIECRQKQNRAYNFTHLCDIAVLLHLLFADAEGSAL